jgi:hypothetical protein
MAEDNEPQLPNEEDTKKFAELEHKMKEVAARLGLDSSTKPPEINQQQPPPKEEQPPPEEVKKKVSKVGEMSGSQKLSTSEYVMIKVKAKRKQEAIINSFEDIVDMFKKYYKTDKVYGYLTDFDCLEMCCTYDDKKNELTVLSGFFMKFMEGLKQNTGWIEADMYDFSLLYMEGKFQDQYLIKVDKTPVDGQILVPLRLLLKENSGDLLGDTYTLIQCDKEGKKPQVTDGQGINGETALELLEFIKSIDYKRLINEKIIDKGDKLQSFAYYAGDYKELIRKGIIKNENELGLRNAINYEINNTFIIFGELIQSHYATILIKAGKLIQ